MQDTYDQFTARNTVVIAVSQEDTDLESHAKFFKAFKGKTPPFDIVADLDRKKTKKYDRTTTYLIDTKGVVREIFPATVRMRPDWRAVLNKIDELQLNKPSESEKKPDA